MDIRQMKYFKTIVETGTISKAAKKLHMAQPPLSMQLKQLEDELGVVLLKRGNKQVELTDAGNRFYKRCLQILDLTELTKSELNQDYYNGLKVGITSSNSGFIQNKAVQEFILSHPEIHYSINEGSTYEILELLLSHSIDIGIVRTPFDTSKVNTIYLNNEPMIAIGKDKYFKDDYNHLNDFKDIPLIIHQRYLPFINDYCLDKQIQIKVKVTCDDSRTSLIWANSGIGVAIIPYNILNIPFTNNLTYKVLLDDNLDTSSVLITRKNESLSPIIKEFIESIKIVSL